MPEPEVIVWNPFTDTLHGWQLADGAKVVADLEPPSE